VTLGRVRRAEKAKKKSTCSDRRWHAVRPEQIDVGGQTLLSVNTEPQFRGIERGKLYAGYALVERHTGKGCSQTT